MDLKKYIDENGHCVIPDEVTEIEEEAFKDCTSLISISVPDSVTIIKNFAFKGCSSLTGISVPDSVKTIGVQAFAFCNSLTNVSIPCSVKVIGWGTFMNCTSLKCVSVPSSVMEIGSEAFKDCAALTDICMSDYITKIGLGAFKGCSSLRNIYMPNSVKQIGESAFEDCSSLIDISIPNSVDKIKEGTFKNCTSLTNVSIPNSVEQIYGDFLFESVGAFEGCTSLTDISVPDSVIKIGNSTFRGCSSLKRFYCPERLVEQVKCIGVPERAIIREVYSDENKSIYKDGMCIFYGSIAEISNNDVSKRNDIRRVKILEGVCKIGNNAFKRCKKLTEVVIPNSVSSVGEDAFKDCKSLIRVRCSPKLVGRHFIEDGAAMVKIGDANVCEGAVAYLKKLNASNDTVILQDDRTKCWDYFADWSDKSASEIDVNINEESKEELAVLYSDAVSYDFISAPAYMPAANANGNEYGITTSYVGECISFNELNEASASAAPVVSAQNCVSAGEREAQID